MKKVCECGEEFETLIKAKRYCCGRCRVREHMKRYRERRKMGEGRKGVDEKTKSYEGGISFEEKILEGYRCGCKKQEGSLLCRVHGRM